MNDPACPFQKRECSDCNGDFMWIREKGDHLRATPCDCGHPCAVCGDTGFLHVVDEQGYSKVRACRRQRLDQRATWFNEAKLPGRYLHATLTNFETRNRKLQRARSGAFKFASSFEPGMQGLLWFGECGTGKTHLMVAVLRYLIIQRGVRARFVEFVHLLSDLRATFDGGVSMAEVMAPLVRVPVLAIDELGKGRGSEWELQVLDELVTRRYNARRTTLFTSNFFPDNAARGDQPSLRERVGERVYSRLREMCTPSMLAGEDFRQSKDD
ncbi:MAG: ATP-binding protein [Myxococcales bacterium]|nr:ATP-binding protein [Myxococcales bacterium]MCB9535328.1 ATP-binding protein [Myxococcales bacterium]